MAYKSGTSEINATTSGLNLQHGHTFSSTSGTSQSKIAMELEPPEKISLIKWIGIFAIPVVIVSQLPFPLFFQIIASAGIIYFSFQKLKDFKNYNLVIWPKEYSKWKSSFICLKCGTKFIPQSIGDA